MVMGVKKLMKIKRNMLKDDDLQALREMFSTPDPAEKLILIRKTVVELRMKYGSVENLLEIARSAGDAQLQRIAEKWNYYEWVLKNTGAI